MTAMIDNDTIIFKIIDDGVGISKETIQQIFSPADGVYLGYGIRNVDQRIKLHFGPSYGVRIDSRPRGGTTVLITIPALAQ
ncbi:Histidine kinase-, DNA gyrase B-, and HSP90-like ATPase [compost metagenome]